MFSASKDTINKVEKKQKTKKKRQSSQRGPNMRRILYTLAGFEDLGAMSRGNKAASSN